MPKVLLIGIGCGSSGQLGRKRVTNFTVAVYSGSVIARLPAAVGRREPVRDEVEVARREIDHRRRDTGRAAQMRLQLALVDAPHFFTPSSRPSGVGMFTVSKLARASS